MASLAESILLHLANNNEKFINSLDLAQIYNEDHQKIVGAIKSIQALGEVRTCFSERCPYEWV